MVIKRAVYLLIFNTLCWFSALLQIA